ncbi:hypothetical protein PIB30_058253 [Stylosanthes scabra]|uniref:Uncharacterized protein n=1 Tax=Stylosanthes scabra TaxID=79078 RepID=A0ABU6YIR9_9FABA|nr:hypothetical protein [Stylosanthes scabra]
MDMEYAFNPNLMPRVEEETLRMKTTCAIVARSNNELQADINKMAANHWSNVVHI